MRIQPALSQLQLDMPIQFGLYATVTHRSGSEVTPYGGILRDITAFAPNASKRHARKIPNTSFVLDGLPLAKMFRRPVPHTKEGLQALLNAGMDPLLPSSADDAAMQRFRSSAFGFMANTERLHKEALALLPPHNVKLGYRKVKVDGHDVYSIPVLVAKEDIAEGVEIICPYGTEERVTSAAAAAPACRPPLTLVLGMAFVKEDYAEPGAARTDTSIAAMRDRARLLQLEKEGRSIITFNNNNAADQCAPHLHIQARFDQRAVGELIDSFGGAGQLTFDAIYADYFRFPSEYMRVVYGEFLRSMLPALIKRGVMTSRTELILPNLKGLVGELPPFASPQGPVQLQRTPISAADYPLFVATQKVAAEELGAYKNEKQLEQLDPKHPFLRLTQAPAAQSSAPAAAAQQCSGPLLSDDSALAASRLHMKTYGWVLFLPCPDAPANFVQQWLQWAHSKPKRDWEEKRGEWFQLNAADVRPTLLDAAVDLGREFLLRAIAEKTFLVELKALKVMSSPPGKGLQDDHCDAATLLEAEGCYTVIIYLTAGDSTALPCLPYDKEMHRVCWELDAAAAAKAKLKIKMTTFPVLPGSALVLSHKTLHHGPKNTGASNRITLFQHWVPKEGVLAKQTPDSELQRLPFGLA